MQRRIDVRCINDRDDKLAICNVYEKSWKHAYKGIISKTYLDSLQGRKWANVLNSTALTHVIMPDGKDVIGTACTCASRYEELKNYGEIVSVYLLPEYIGKGYGKQLLQFATDRLKEQGYKNIFLWVPEKNRRARGFYEAQGFKENGRSMMVSIGEEKLKEIMYTYCI